ncbi:MAG: trehalose-6-phosphate synthase [Dehalococcoidia bacterium]
MASNDSPRNPESGRLVIVSNRLPVVQEGDGDGKRRLPVSGLVSAVHPFMQRVGGLWFGWNGATVAAGPSATPAISRVGPLTLASMELSERTAWLFYTTFSNRTLWPVLHGFLENMSVRGDAHRAYRAVNERFAAALVPLLEAGDRIWVHDYHLIPFARSLRSAGWAGKVGFFLHTPFPPREIFAALPWANEFLEDLLSYDLVGLQTDRYAQNLVETLEAELSDDHRADSTPSFPGQPLVKAYPVGTDPHFFAELAAAADSLPIARTLRRLLSGQRMLLGVDRLDYTKGIGNRILAFGRLLDRHPSLRGRVTLVQIAVPSRTKVREYVEERERVERLVSQVNGQYSAPGWTPVQYFYRAYPQGELAWLYRNARACLVTPLRDGMNLVAKEYVASQADDPGVLVLSKFCGASEELAAALQVNPYDIAGTADAMYRALEMPLAERRDRWQALDAVVQTNTGQRWAETFLEDLSGGLSALPDRCDLSAAIRSIDNSGRNVRATY